MDNHEQPKYSVAGALLALILLIVIVVLIVMFIVWLIWYYWDCDRISTHFKRFNVDCDRSACIKVCKDSYISRIALCAEEDGEVWIESGCGRETLHFRVCAHKTLWWEPENHELEEGYDLIISSDVRLRGVAKIYNADVCKGCKKYCKEKKNCKKDYKKECKPEKKGDCKKKGYKKCSKYDDGDYHSDW